MESRAGQTFSLLLVLSAMVASFLAYLQADVFGPAYLVVSLALVLSSAINFLSLQVSLLALLVSELTILAAPLLRLPPATWSDRVLATRALLLPAITILVSFVIWFLNSISLHRKATNSKLKNMQRRQEILQAQMLLIKKQPRTLKLPPLSEFVRPNTVDQHGGAKQKTVSDQVLLSELIDFIRESISVAQSKVSEEKASRLTLNLPAPMSLPIAVAAEKNDLKNMVTSALAKSLNSLNGEDGVVRVTLKVGYKAVSITIEDNGWGLREKFSPNAVGDHELSLREIQAMVSFWGGRLEVLSRLGVGSRIHFELVRVDAFSSDETIESKEEKPKEITDEFKADATSRITTGSR